MTSSDHSWCIRQGTACFRTSDWFGEFDLCEPQSGLHSIRFQQNEIRGFAALQVGPTKRQTPDEYYVRGSDLVINYLPLESNFRQIQWHVTQTEAFLSVDLLISTSTDLLDADASIAIRTTARSADFFAMTSDGSLEPLAEGDHLTGVSLVRLAGEKASYAEMVFPSDFAVEASTMETNAFSYRLLQDRLEKGVIRRSRVRGLFLPREEDVAGVRRAYTEFVQAAPPLTA